MAKKIPTADAIVESTAAQAAATMAALRKTTAKKTEPEKQKGNAGRPREYKDGTARLTLSIPKETKRRLAQLAIEDSTPDHRSNLTQVIIKLADEEIARREKAKTRNANK